MAYDPGTGCFVVVAISRRVIVPGTCSLIVVVISRTVVVPGTGSVKNGTMSEDLLSLELATLRPLPPGVVLELASLWPLPPGVVLELASLRPLPSGVVLELASLRPLPPGVVLELASMRPSPPGVVLELASLKPLPPWVVLELIEVVTTSRSHGSNVVPHPRGPVVLGTGRLVIKSTCSRVVVPVPGHLVIISSSGRRLSCLEVIVSYDRHLRRCRR